MAASGDLSKEHLDLSIKSLKRFSAKSRNHYRAAIRQFLMWAVRKDYLPATHPLPGPKVLLLWGAGVVWLAYTRPATDDRRA